MKIAQLKQCFNEEEINNDAGKSSNMIHPSLNYRNDNIIGINNGNGKRSDRKKQNNYTLNYGFKLGKQSLNINKSNGIINNIDTLGEWNSIQNSSEFAELFLPGDINNIISGKRLFPNLHELIAFAYTDNIIDNIKNYKMTKTCSNQTSSKNSNKQNVFLMIDISDYTIQIKCGNNNYAMISQATINNVQYYDIYYNGQGIGNSLSETMQGCIASFESGGKNDKEVCRDIMNKKCGNELDYRCKQSGLYDILLQSPVTNYILPPQCLGYVTDNDVDPLSDDNKAFCAEWIDRNFVMGTIIPRPSQFLSYSMSLQNDISSYYQNNGTITVDKTKFNVDSTGGTLQAFDNSTITSITSVELKKEADKVFSNMVNSSYSLQLSLLLCISSLLFL